MSKTTNWSVIKCPECQSTQFTINAKGRCRCSDCETIYDVPAFAGAPKRIAEPGKRHRRDNGPAVFEVEPVEAPTPKQLGTSHLYTYEVLEGGPRALIAAHHQAAKLSEKFGEEIEAQWCLATKWLQDLMVTHRARARYALQWRPRLLAVVSLTRSIMLGCRAGNVAYNTVKAHRRADPAFEHQIIAAEEHAVELLHDVTFRDALEGTCEPVFWQGVRIGHVRKFDNRLRLEMLRAHMPAKFKTPGTGNQGGPITNNNIMVVDNATLLAIQGLRAESLEEMRLAQAHEVAALPAIPI